MAASNRAVLQKFFKRRLVAILAAHVIMGFSITLLRFSLFGNDPFSCMQLGYSNVSGLSYGTCVLIFNAIVIGPIYILDKSYVQLGTVINMLLTGPIVDIWYWCLSVFTTLTEPTMFTRIVLLISGVIICCLGVSLYMMSHLGMGPYDAIGWIVAARSKGKFQFRSARVMIDTCAVAIGFICGSIVSIGTLIMASCTGPLVSFFNEYVSVPLIYKGRKI